MIVRNLQRLSLPLLSLFLGHVGLVRDPVFPVAVWGDRPKQARKTELLQMNDLSRGNHVKGFDRHIFRVVGVHLPILFQARQEVPTVRADQFQIRYAGQRNAMRFLEYQLSKQTISGWKPRSFAVVIISRNDSFFVLGPPSALTSSPYSRQSQGCAASPFVQSRVARLIPSTTAFMLPRPVAGDKFYVAGIGLVERRIVYH